MEGGVTICWTIISVLISWGPNFLGKIILKVIVLGSIFLGVFSRGKCLESNCPGDIYSGRNWLGIIVTGPNVLELCNVYSKIILGFISSEAATKCLGHFAIFTGKYLSQNLFFNKIRGLSLQLYEGFILTLICIKWVPGTPELDFWWPFLINL